jgi:hypothetical protein
MVYYTRSTNTLNLLNDAGTTWMAGTVGGTGTLQNSQCSVALGSATSPATATALTLTLPMTFAPAFSGAKNVYLYAAGAGGQSSGWQTRGTWTVTGDLRTTPTITWATPANITYGTPLSAAQLNATASVPGTFTYTPPAGTVLGVGAGQSLSVAFTPTDVTNYTTATATVLITVGPLTVTMVTADTVTPASGSGLSQTFALQYGDTAGAPDLATTWVWFNATFAASSANSCLLYYARPSNTLNLLNDAGTAWLSGAVGGSGTLQNSQCAVALGGTGAPTSTTALTLTLPMTFAPAFLGAKNVYLYATNASGQNSGWQPRGTWTVPEVVTTVTVVTAETVAPASGSGVSQTFAAQYGDTAGATDLATAWVWFNATFGSAASSCMVYYTRSTNTLNLLNDAGTAWMAGTVGGSGTLQNSQCAVALGSTGAPTSGTALTLTLSMTFAPAFSGAKNVYLYAAGAGGQNSGWQTRGTWTVTGAVSADAVAAAPSRPFTEHRTSRRESARQDQSAPSR